MSTITIPSRDIRPGDRVPYARAFCTVRAVLLLSEQTIVRVSGVGGSEHVRAYRPEQMVRVARG